MALLLANLPARSNAQVTATGQLDPTQVYTTGNVVQPTNAGTNTTPWVNGVYQDNLTCWGWGDPGYCGPNAIVRPGNNINFSFGLTNLYQLQSIASILPDTGTGLRVNGYNFGFTAKNGNGWDDGRLDYLSAYVSFYDSKGSTVFNKNYDLNSQFNWTTFNYSETFKTPYASKDLGSVQYGFVGRDNNFWAGPYGPEVYNVSFSLKYSVDPCYVDVLSSPSCPGYVDALAKLTPQTSPTTSEPIITTTISPTTSAQAPVVEPTTTVVASTTPTAISTPQTASTSTTTAPTSAPAKVGEDSAKSAQSGSSVSLSTILNIVANEQSRIGNVERSVVQQAVDQAVKEAEKTQKDAERIAGTAQQQSIAASMQATMNQSATTPTLNTQPGQGTGLTFFSSTPQGGIGLSGSRSTQGSIDPLMRQDSPIIVGAVQQSVIRPSFSLSTNIDVRRNEEVELPKSEGIRFGDRNQAFNLIEEKSQTVQQTTTTTTTTTVNQKTTDNEAAAGVTLASIAMQPRGYESYFSTLPDAQFYAPKEIYRGQKTVDNARALRQLSTDRLHQEMVNQQFNGR